MTPRRLVGVVLALALVGGACGGATGNHAGGSTLRVLAASSLTEAFTALARDFERAHPGTEVALTFGSSSSLATQVLEGAPADVLATADAETMARAVDGGAVGTPSVFAQNRLTILVASGNPLGIRGLEDLARPDVTLVACAPAVPCGRLAAAALTRGGVDARPRSLEDNVKGVVAKVTLGEADAGIVYETDARAAGRAADSVALEDAGDRALEAACSIATVQAPGKAPSPAATEWIRFVESDRGRGSLASFGFRAAP